jgi:hypothetical protein
MTIASIIYAALGRSEDELRTSEAALDYARRSGAKRQQVLATANLADFYLKRHDYDTALRLAQQALPLAREVKDRSSESVALTNAGLALIALGQHDAGRALVREALVLEERAGALTQMLDIQEELGHALERAGLLREAWQALSEHRRLADEVYQRKQQQAVLELQEGFDAERRQRELAELQTDNQLKEAQLTQRDLQQRRRPGPGPIGRFLEHIGWHVHALGGVEQQLNQRLQGRAGMARARRKTQHQNQDGQGAHPQGAQAQQLQAVMQQLRLDVRRGAHSLCTNCRRICSRICPS